MAKVVASGMMRKVTKQTSHVSKGGNDYGDEEIKRAAAYSQDYTSTVRLNFFACFQIILYEA